MKKRAQAAMEFLMTYGWALILVIVAIGALAFFGVLNPSKLTPEQCVLGPGFACSGFKLDTATNTIQLNVQNGFGKNFDLFLIHIKKEDPLSISEVCGGRFGYIVGTVAIPFQPLFNGNLPPTLFKDGQILSPYYVPSDGVVPAIPLAGIYCPAFAATCCSGATLLFNTPAVPIPQVCPYFAPNDCATLSLTKGKKYSFNLVVTYSEVDSSLTHQRIGTLTAVAE